MRPSEALAKHRDATREIVFSYQLSDPRVFGSTARGEDTDDSDLDIIVRRVGHLSYFDLFRLEDELASVLGAKVDVRTEGEFSKRILDRIKRDFIAL
jgi:predicted nucleotidyltransferase